jgi:hypothetical protein
MNQWNPAGSEARNSHAPTITKPLRNPATPRHSRTSVDRGLERLIELAEDMADIRAAEESREELRRTQTEPTPWDQVKADLGLV